MKLFILVAVLVAGIMAAKKKTTSTSASFCTDFKEYGSEYSSDYAERYYKMPLLGHCRSQHLGNWKPTYRIEARTSECPAGSVFWEEKGTCYKDGDGGKNYRDAEQHCNSMNGHLFVPNSNEEMQWVTTRTYQRGGWHWLGFFCSTGNSHEIKDSRTVTRENTALIASRLQARGAHPLHHHSQACWMNQAERHDRNWYLKFHHQNCNEGRHYVCEIPISA